MLILVEGCDGVGKTTFVEQLVLALQHRGDEVATIHRGPLRRHPLLEYEGDLDDYAPGAGRSIVCDRWHLGEMVYGPLWRGGSKITPAMWRHIEMYLNSRGAVLVLLTHSVATIQERLISRGERLLDLRDVPVVMRSYLDVYGKSVVAHRTMLRDPVADSVEHVVDVAARAEHRATHVAKFTTYIGNSYPGALILGERRGPHPEQSVQRAAFAPYSATSGEYLLDSMARAMPPKAFEMIGIANALEEPVEELWQQIGRPPVVTLGREAHKATAAAGVPHGEMPHPQFIRRFHHKAGLETYGPCVLDAALNWRPNREWRP